jgi:serine protease AprX
MRPRPVRRVLLAALLAGCAPIATTSTAAATTPRPRGGPTTVSVIVEGRPGADAVVARRVRELGGRVSRALPIIHGVAAAVPTQRLAALAADPAIGAVAPDARARMSATTASDGLTAPTSDYRQAIRVDQVWQAGDQGQGVTVALVDTGVSASPDLQGRILPVTDDVTGRTAPCENLSGEPTCDDTYGHGTFVAGIIAGNGAASDGTWSGVAPRANLVVVKVAGRDGASDVSNVLAAIQWVVSFKDRYHIRVLNLSFATDSTQSYRSDPFDYAVERAWDAGIVVVVAASNRGPGRGTVAKPGDDPLVITVGAVDDRGTPGIGDDALPNFSARGPTAADALAKPDVVAPGAHIVSLRAAGSTIDEAFPDPVDTAYRRGSGTSFSTAATSGVVALMLARTPGLEPDEVKYALAATARPLPASGDPMAVGAGEVDATVAVNPPAGTANAGIVRSTGKGSLDVSRGGVSVQTATLPQVAIDGMLTAQDVAWDPSSFLLGWNPVGWYTSTWYITPWLPVTWSGDGWPGHNWAGGDWEGAEWDGTSVDGSYGTPLEGSAWFGAWD